MRGAFLVEVKKNSGDTETFDREKLKQSVKKSGASDEEAEQVTQDVESKVKDGTPTSKIKEWTTNSLKRINDEAANAYQWFKKEIKI